MELVAVTTLFGIEGNVCGAVIPSRGGASSGIVG